MGKRVVRVETVVIVVGDIGFRWISALKGRQMIAQGFDVSSVERLRPMENLMNISK